MPLLEVIRPARKEVPDPIIACKVSKGIQAAFDQLAEKTYKVTREQLLRACVLDCLKHHEQV